MGKNVKLIIGIIVVVVVGCLAGICLHVVKSMKVSLPCLGFDVPGGQSYSVSEMVEANEKMYDRLSLEILDTNVPTAKLSDDKKEVYVGDTSGYVHLDILINGKSADKDETRDVYLFVSLSEDEQAEVIDNSRRVYSDVDKYLHDEFFSEENNTEDGRRLFSVKYNSEDASGLQKDMTESLFTEYIDSFDGALLQGIVAGYDQNPFEPKLANTAYLYHALYKTKDGKHLYLDITGKPENGSLDIVQVTVPAPDDGGNYLYDILTNAFSLFKPSTEIPRNHSDILIGNDFMLYSQEIDSVVNQQDGVDYVSLHSLRYAFCIPIDD